METVRTRMKLQELALVAMVKIGEAEKKTIDIYLKQANGKGFDKKEHTFYKIKEAYRLRRDPREESPVIHCCASCVHKQYEEDHMQLMCKCKLTGQKVEKSLTCDKYDMIDWMKRI